MRTLLLAACVLLFACSLAHGQSVIRSEAVTGGWNVTWDSVWVGSGTIARTVWIGVSHLSGAGSYAIAVENDTAAATKKIMVVYPNNGIQWFPPVRARWLRARGLDTCAVQRFYFAQ